MKILFFGDIVGKSGRQGLIKILPDLKSKYNADLAVANGENLSHGSGINRAAYNEMIDGGIDFLTSGNHIWAKKEINDILNDSNARIIRPANYPPGASGQGYKILEIGAYKVLFINLLGRLFMKKSFDCPFRKVNEILDDEELNAVKIKFIDFHAEATSEKIAFGYHVDGRVTAVVGTHTHVLTNDARIFPQQTFYITDAGMVGPRESVLGIDAKLAIQEFITQRPVKMDASMDNNIIVNGVFLDIANDTGLVKKFDIIKEEVMLPQE